MKTRRWLQVAAVGEGTRFEVAYGPVPLTLLSHTSMLSGRLPPAHPVRTNDGLHIPRRAAGLRVVLDVLEEEKLIDRAAFMGDRLLQGLDTLREISIVGDVRGMGLRLGVEFVADKDSRTSRPRMPR